MPRHVTKDPDDPIKREQERRERDKLRILHHETWPRWPFLTLARWTHEYPTDYLAYLYADDATIHGLTHGQIRIRYGQIWDAHPGDRTELYNSWDQFFAAGWRVD